MLCWIFAPAATCPPVAPAIACPLEVWLPAVTWPPASSPFTRPLPLPRFLPLTRSFPPTRLSPPTRSTLPTPTLLPTRSSPLVPPLPPPRWSPSTRRPPPARSSPPVRSSPPTRRPPPVRSSPPTPPSPPVRSSLPTRSFPLPPSPPEATAEFARTSGFPTGACPPAVNATRMTTTATTAVTPTPAHTPILRYHGRKTTCPLAADAASDPAALPAVGILISNFFSICDHAPSTGGIGRPPSRNGIDVGSSGMFIGQCIFQKWVSTSSGYHSGAILRYRY